MYQTGQEILKVNIPTTPTTSTSFRIKSQSRDTEAHQFNNRTLGSFLRQVLSLFQMCCHKDRYNLHHLSNHLGERPIFKGVPWWEHLNYFPDVVLVEIPTFSLTRCFTLTCKLLQPSFHYKSFIASNVSRGEMVWLGLSSTLLPLKQSKTKSLNLNLSYALCKAE